MSEEGRPVVGRLFFCGVTKMPVTIKDCHRPNNMKEKKMLIYFGTLAIIARMLFTNMFTAMANRMTPKNLRKMKIKFSPSTF